MLTSLKSSTLARYILTGGLAYVIEMGCLYLLKSIGIKDVAAVAISFWVGFIVAFLLQKFIAFQDRRRERHIVVKQLLLYSLLVGFNYCFTLLVINLLEGHTVVYVSRTIAIAIITAWNFLIYRKLFRGEPIATA